MGATKRWAEEQEEQERLKAIAQYTLDHDLLERDEAIGIAKLVASQGDTNLTEKQRHVFEKYIRPHTIKECDMCNELLTIEELEFEDGLCGHCRHLLGQD